MKNDTDLRVVKTLDNIRRSFFELLRTKKLNEITVKGICDGARCSRNTFYMHYPYKEALYEQIVDECIATVQYGFRPLDKRAQETDKQYISRSINNSVEAIYAARELLSVILHSDSSNTFCWRLTDAVRASMLEGSARLSPEGSDSVAYQLIARYCASGIVGFLLGWLENPDMGVEEAEQILSSLHYGPFSVGLSQLRAYGGGG